MKYLVLIIVFKIKFKTLIIFFWYKLITFFKFIKYFKFRIKKERENYDKEW